MVRFRVIWPLVATYRHTSTTSMLNSSVNRSFFITPNIRFNFLREELPVRRVNVLLKSAMISNVK